MKSTFEQLIDNPLVFVGKQMYICQNLDGSTIRWSEGIRIAAVKPVYPHVFDERGNPVRENTTAKNRSGKFYTREVLDKSSGPASVAIDLVQHGGDQVGVGPGGWVEVSDD